MIHLVVAPDQACGLPHRFIGEKVALLRDVVHYANEADLPLAILSLDQEKAFDCVDWPFLQCTLSRMGFGPSFIQWVDLLYSDIRSAILINGYTSRYSKPSRGGEAGLPSVTSFVCVNDGSPCSQHSGPPFHQRHFPASCSCAAPVVSLYADETGTDLLRRWTCFFVCSFDSFNFMQS